MLTRSLLLIFLFTVNIQLRAQTALPEFAPHGAHWTYEVFSTNSFYPESYVEFLNVANNDTVITGKTCRILNMDGYGTYFAYRDSLKIWVHTVDTTQPWKLLNDFGWNVGDTVVTPVIGYMCLVVNHGNIFDSVRNYVEGKGDTLINGFLLPVLHLHAYATTVVMNLGCTTNWLVPYTFISSENSYPILRCYHDDVIGQFKAPKVLNCDTVPSAGLPVLSTESLKLYPNPASNEFLITGVTTKDITTLEIFATDGRKIKQIDQPGSTIPLADLPNGMYVTYIRLSNGIITTRKLVVQH